MLGNQQYMEGPYTFLPLNGGHWLMQSNFQEVSRAISEHLSGSEAIPGTPTGMLLSQAAVPGGLISG